MEARVAELAVEVAATKEALKGVRVKEGDAHLAATQAMVAATEAKIAWGCGGPMEARLAAVESRLAAMVSLETRVAASEANILTLRGLIEGMIQGKIKERPGPRHDAAGGLRYAASDAATEIEKLDLRYSKLDADAATLETLSGERRSRAVRTCPFPPRPFWGPSARGPGGSEATDA